jgi:hypothetical protein
LKRWPEVRKPPKMMQPSRAAKPTVTAKCTCPQLPSHHQELCPPCLAEWDAWEAQLDYNTAAVDTTNWTGPMMEAA